MCPLCNISNRKDRSYIKAEYKMYEISLISATHSIVNTKKIQVERAKGGELGDCCDNSYMH